ncbi:helix-turn-helix domain-containing protein [Rhizobium leguminosarum]|uniref:helix-turn-helix domain-containing protein n=1 Tax=Rhizobium leguminosarum TaxID=384 RepID=UPI001FEE763C|nr:helix-turn-helix domain-containing protein [Rhizobium leguminosarum]
MNIPVLSEAELEAMSKDIVWGVKDIAKIINRNERQTYHLLSAGFIPARKVGAQWVASKSHLLEWMREIKAQVRAG